MPIYKVDIHYDMGMSGGRENLSFEADDDAAAKAYMEENKGKDLSVIKRNVSFDTSSLSRVVD